jgi:hypothetical protein
MWVPAGLRVVVAVAVAVARPERIINLAFVVLITQALGEAA